MKALLGRTVPVDSVRTACSVAMPRLRRHLQRATSLRRWPFPASSTNSAADERKYQTLHDFILKNPPDGYTELSRMCDHHVIEQRAVSTVPSRRCRAGN
jgi:hypothetical protein